jgi:hypothetical protein
MGYEDSYRVSRRKTMFMVEYLRARRDPSRRFIRLHRRWHLESVRRLKEVPE